MSLKIDGDVISGTLQLGVALFPIAVTLFLLVVAWRLMRAHERLADSVENLRRLGDHKGGIT